MLLTPAREQTDIESRFYALPTEHQEAVKSLILEIVTEQGTVFLSDLNHLIVSSCYLTHGIDFDYRYYTDTAKAAVWELEKSDLDRSQVHGFSVVSITEF